MTVSKARNMLAFIGFCTLLYMFGSWAIDLINDILVWIESTRAAQ